MTTSPAEPDLGHLASVPRLVLDEDGLDILELALSGALPGLPAWPGAAEGGNLVLTDAENVPLAHVVGLGGPDHVVRGLRPLAHGIGPQWDPDVRRSPAGVREILPDPAAGARVLAAVFDDVPTREDVEAVAEAVRAAGAAAVLSVIPVARRARPPEKVGWPGLTRAVRAAAGQLASTLGPDITVITVVVPWPSRSGGLGPADSFDSVLARYGATEVFRPRERRSAGARNRIEALSQTFSDAVRDLYPEGSAGEILRAHRPDHTPGGVVFFTGLSGSGKSTIARALAADLADDGGRHVTLLDGDEVRQHLSAELGFDDRSRELNIERIAYVASIVAAHGGIAIAAPIAPFASGRSRARSLVVPHGTFLLVHVSTPLEVCEARDRKGLYARARAGEIPNFTGISSRYETPDDADVVVDTTDTEIADAVALIRAAFERKIAEGATTS